MIGIIVLLLWIGILLQKEVLLPLKYLDRAISASRDTGEFAIPHGLSDNEIRFLAATFQAVFDRRQQAEAQLRKSEARERAKSQELERAIDNLKKLQLQLIQTEKMSSLVQLVAGVAHEINNPVSFIHGNLVHAQDYIRDLALEESKSKHPQIEIHLESIAPKQVRVRIVDNGTGMSETVRSKLFDPFFTTKLIGKGTGLGMSISYQIIVERHGGKLTCQSTPGEGTEFAIEIPIRQSAVHVA
ncbi:MAG: sensor histidine kinase [Cyanobacteria bacterium J055]|nr:MAG: sensor histidine kinase [Cyanobacteria bacterium J055]